MKLILIVVAFFLFAGFSSCEDHMDIRNIVAGTPTNADTVLPRKNANHERSDSLTQANLPKVFRR